MGKLKKYFARTTQYAKLYSKLEHCPEWKMVLGSILCSVLGRCTLREYYVYRFINLSRRGQLNYVSNVAMKRWNKKNSEQEYLGILDEKESALMRFDSYINRSWVGERNHNTDKDYEDFLLANQRCIVKPSDGTCGHGIHFVELESFNIDKLRQLCEDEHALVEELIIQHPTLSKLYPNSVNTIRVGTLYGEIFSATLRVGSGGVQIDNYSNGGIAASIDLDTGIVFARAEDQYGNKYLKHPDTGVTFPGFIVPYWDECKDLVRQMALDFKGMPFIGWDIAITEDGPEFVEANEESAIIIFQNPLDVV